MDAYTTVPAQRTEEENKKDKFGIGSVKHPAVQDALNRIAWNEVPFPRFSFPVQAAKRDIRIRNQAGCFTFHVPDMSFLDELKLTIRRLKIPHGNKGRLRKELASVQMHPFRVFGDLGNLAKTVRGLFK